ncbi:hypothetical protein E2C01_035542 [Portunus trituberculatus]|uniref:Ionotropic glutamate receptor C-terminal domain-containing protein n=1 Tax=Portunus trituberculatus TaxID=210409 RepID=A0A5B7F4G3_PORTR|nr:hypothetical protein [Portunus trituberculatus]
MDMAVSVRDATISETNENIKAVIIMAAWWREPHVGQVRALAGIWLLSSFVLATVYRSNLKAMLILPHLSLPFNSLDEFVQTDINCFVVESSVIHDTIQVRKIFRICT